MLRNIKRNIQTANNVFIKPTKKKLTALKNKVDKLMRKGGKMSHAVFTFNNPQHTMEEKKNLKNDVKKDHKSLDFS